MKIKITSMLFIFIMLIGCTFPPIDNTEQKQDATAQEILKDVDISKLSKVIEKEVKTAIGDIVKGISEEITKDQSTTTSTEDVQLSKVVRVIDGDTAIINIDGKDQRVRFLLVDSPESVHPNKEPEPFGKEASDFVKELLEGKEVILEFDVGKKDRYDRYLAHLYTTDGTWVNKELVERGLAKVVYFEPNKKYYEELKDVEIQAKNKKVGIWSKQ